MVELTCNGGKQLKKSILIAWLVLLGIFLIGAFEGLHFKESDAIPWDVDIVRTLDIDDCGKAVLFEDRGNKTFGIAELEKKFGFLFRYDGGTFGYMVEEGRPFQAAGNADENDFLVAVKTAEDSEIKYIALGNHMEEFWPSDPYELSLEDVKAQPDDYHWKEVVDQYVLFVVDEYTEDTWTIRAFDKEGSLIADELFGAEARYIDW